MQASDAKIRKKSSIYWKSIFRGVLKTEFENGKEKKALFTRHGIIMIVIIHFIVYDYLYFLLLMVKWRNYLLFCFVLQRWKISIISSLSFNEWKWLLSFDAFERIIDFSFDFVRGNWIFLFSFKVHNSAWLFREKYCFSKSLRSRFCCDCLVFCFLLTLTLLCVKRNFLMEK